MAGFVGITSPLARKTPDPWDFGNPRDLSHGFVREYLNCCDVALRVRTVTAGLERIEGTGFAFFSADARMKVDHSTIEVPAAECGLSKRFEFSQFPQKRLGNYSQAESEASCRLVSGSDFSECLC